MLLLVGVVAAIVIGRCNVAGASLEAQLDRGVDALVQAIDGDRAQFVEAKKAFARAAGVTFWDGYPVFMLELAQALEDDRAALAHPAARAVMEELARGHFDAAIAALPAIPPDFAGRAHVERAAVALARSAAARRNR